MNETLRTQDSETEPGSFGSLSNEREPWSQHLAKAKEFLRQKFSGEKVDDGVYRLADNARYNNKRMMRALGDIIKSWDEDNDVIIPKEVGRELEKYVDNDKYWVGIHHCEQINGADFENDNILKDMMTNGIKNFGAAQQGIFDKHPPLIKTLEECTGMLNAVISIKRGRGFSTGAVVVAVPREYIDEDGDLKSGAEDKVYNRDEYGNAVIKPEFNVGFITAHVPGENICRYRSRDDLLKYYSEK